MRQLGLFIVCYEMCYCSLRARDPARLVNVSVCVRVDMLWAYLTCVFDELLISTAHVDALGGISAPDWFSMRVVLTGFPEVQLLWHASRI